MNTSSLQQNIRQTFLELIAINSPHPDDGEVKAYIRKRFDEGSVSYKLDAYGNILAFTQGSGNPFMLSTHFDIPEPTPEARYEEEGNIIRATGSNILGADPKSGLAVLIELAVHLAKDKKTYRPVEFLLTRGEEAGLLGAINLDYSLVSAKEGFVLDQDGRVSEVVIQAPGFIKVDGRFIGKVVHPCEPHNGVNALQIACDAFNRIGWGYSSEGITWNVGIATSGTARNSVPGEYTFQAELRGFDTAKLKAEDERLKKIFTATAEKYGGVYRGEHEMFFEGYELDTSEEFFQKLDKSLTHFSLTPNYIRTFGGSDANIFNANGIRCAAIGSGYYHPHQYNEYVDLKEMGEIFELLENYLRQVS